MEQSLPSKESDFNLISPHIISLIAGTWTIIVRIISPSKALQTILQSEYYLFKEE